MHAAALDFDKAYALGPEFQDLALYSAAGAIGEGDRAKAAKILATVPEEVQTNSDTLVIAYYRVKDWPDLIKLMTARTEKPGADAQAWFALAATYYESGDTASAINTLNATVAKFPDAKASADAAIAQIRAGK